jgi:hypothetical protein
MASGQVNRIKRPNTWLQRPMLQNREESSCQTGAVHTWHFSDVTVPLRDVRYRGKVAIRFSLGESASREFRPELMRVPVRGSRTMRPPCRKRGRLDYRLHLCR